MFKPIATGILCCLLLHGFSQPAPKSAISSYRYQAPSADIPSWQWLNLMTSATFHLIVKEGAVDPDSCLLYANRYLGLSRLLVLGEGIEDAQLLAQSQWVDRRDPATGLRLLPQFRGKQRLHQLLLLGAYYVFQPRGYEQWDSATSFLQRALRESDAAGEKKLKRVAHCLLGKVYLDRGEVKQGDSLFNQLIDDCRSSGDRQTEARAYFYWGYYPPPMPASFPARIDRFLKAAELYRGLGNREGEINALMDAGYLQVPIFELSKASESFSKSLHLAERIKYPYTHYHSDALAMATMWIGKFGEPLKYALQSVRTAEVTRDSIGLGYFYSRLGHLYILEGQREEESLKWFLKGLNRFLQDGDAGLSHYLVAIMNNMKSLDRGREGHELLLNIMKKVPPRYPLEQINYHMAFARSYQTLKQYNLAEQNIKKAEQLLNQFPLLRSAQQKALVKLFSGEIYFDAGQYKRAQKYLEAYVSDPFRDKLFKNDLIAYGKLIRIDSVFDDAASAVAHYKIYTQLLDSNYRVSKIRQAEELQVLYETEEKEAQITLLNQKAKLEQANLQQAMLIRNATVGGIVVVLFIAALLYRQSRQRQRTNRVISHKNEQLEHLLKEKEWLLKEIHHRVKNNLQIVMSLLNSQSVYIDNEFALTAIHDSQHRVHAMSLIHQKLYGSDNVSSIDMSVYIREMVTYLADSFDTGQRIRFAYTIEPLQLDVSQAVPLGLILNEAITNAIKYAFPGWRTGEIAISLTQSEHRQYMLLVSDNGVGMPPCEEGGKPGSLGMSLMQGLSEDLEGEFCIESKNGTTIKVTFAPDRGVKRPASTAASFAMGN